MLLHPESFILRKFVFFILHVLFHLLNLVGQVLLSLISVAVLATVIGSQRDVLVDVNVLQSRLFGGTFDEGLRAFVVLVS